MESFTNDAKRSMTKHMLNSCSKELTQTNSMIELRVSELIEWEEVLEGRILEYSKENNIKSWDKETLSIEEDIYFKNIFGNTIEELLEAQERQTEVIKSCLYFLKLLQVKD